MCGDVGIYAVAATLVAFVPIVLQSVNQIFSPTIADLHARGRSGLAGTSVSNTHKMGLRTDPASGFRRDDLLQAAHASVWSGVWGGLGGPYRRDPWSTD